MQSPMHLHLSVAHYIIKYILGTFSRDFFFPTGVSPQLQDYNGSNCIGCLDTRKSTIG